MIDRYTKAVLTLIATALVYLCIVLTPIPGVEAQGTQRPGEPTGPVQAVIVGWRAGETVPISAPAPITVSVNGLVEVRGQVRAEKATERADRVVLVGWEESGLRDGKPGVRMEQFTTKTSLPVEVKQP
ncbi:MAG: hypothetical protein AB7P34_10395 [Vicinamibacterales bacterium]